MPYFLFLFYFLFLLTTLALEPISTCGASSHVDTGGCSNVASISAGECGNVEKAGGNGALPRSADEGINGATAKKGAPVKQLNTVSNRAPQR